MAKPEDKIYDGLAQVAHAIRRSSAMYVALSLLPPDASIEDLKEMTDDLSLHLRGKAGEKVDQPTPGQQPLGVPWQERD